MYEGTRNKMNLFGVQVPETIEIFGVPFLINPITMLIAAFPVIFALVLLTYWFTQHPSGRTVYKHNYDFYNIGPVATVENNAFFANDEQYQATQSQVGSNEGHFWETQPQVNVVDTEDDVTEAIPVLSFDRSAPAYLAYISGGDHLPKKLALEGDEPIRIGRKKSLCELILDDKRVSRLHAVIFLLDSEFHIIDEGSTGGTFINRQKLSMTNSHKLAHNDTINFNEAEYRFEITYQTAGQDNALPSAYPPRLESVGI